MVFKDGETEICTSSEIMNFTKKQVMARIDILSRAKGKTIEEINRSSLGN